MDQSLSETQEQPKVARLSFLRRFGVIGVVLIVIIPLILGLYIFSTKVHLTNNVLLGDKVSKRVEDLPKDGFFLSGVDKIPLKDVKLENLPQTRDVQAAAIYNGRLWTTGDGSLVEFDPKTNAIIAYSDPTKANCDKNFVIIGDNLYAPCRSLGKEAEKDPVSGDPLYHIYKIHLPEYRVDKIYKKKDGLSNQQNFYIASSHPSEIWLATFEGVAQLFTANDRIVFYTKELGISGTAFGINLVIPDKDYVWAVVSSNAYSEGGLALFDKKTGTWTGFGPHVLKEHDQDRFDLESTKNGGTIKLVPGGLQVAYRDGESPRILVEKQYDYATKTWKTLRSVPFDGDNYEPETERLSKEYTAFTNLTYDFGDKPLSNIVIDGKTYEVKGRANLSLSPVINSKRYIVTGGSIDVLKEGQRLPEIFIPLPKNIDMGRPHGMEPPMVNVLTASGSDYIIIINPDAQIGFEGPDYFGTMHVWVVDARTDEIVAEAEGDDKYLWRLKGSYALRKEGNVLVVTSAGEPAFQFDLESREFGIIDDEVAPEN